MTSRVRVAVLGLLVPTATTASADDIAVSVFHPTPTTSGTAFQVLNADVGHDGDLVISSAATYASKPLVVDTDVGAMTVVRHQTMLSLGGAYAFGGKFEAGARLPIYMQSGIAVENGLAPADGAALGDLTLHGKMRFVHGARLRAGAALALTMPTQTAGEFVGNDLPTARVLGLVSIMATNALQFHANAGGLLRAKAQYTNVEQGSGLTWGVGGSFRIAEKLFLDAEAFGDVLPSAWLSRPTTNDPMGVPSSVKTLEWLAGARYQATTQLSIGVAGGRGITQDLGTPEFRGVLTFAYAPSARPLPPLTKPYIEPPVDLTKEDTDYDKLNDAVDKCPEQREDKDGFQDDDGCPDPDNDNDGVLDDKDKCASAAEDKDGAEDDDGCPDLDNDKDGVLDDQDKCPDKPEKINGKEDNDGCPDDGDSLIINTPDRLELFESVVFKDATITKGSTNLLNQLAVTLRARADIRRIRIGVHVQPTKSAKKDQALSDKRAASLRTWLINWGIEADRLEVKGFGGSTPLVPPKTKGAEQINDRVELIILERN